MHRTIAINHERGLHIRLAGTLAHILTGYDCTVKYHNKVVPVPYFDNLVAKKIPRDEELEIEIRGKYAHIPIEMLDRTEF